MHVLIFIANYQPYSQESNLDSLKSKPKIQTLILRHIFHVFLCQINNRKKLYFKPYFLVV